MWTLFPEINLPWYMNVKEVKKVERGGESQGVGAQENRGQGVQEMGEERTGEWEEDKIGGN